jgi:DNA-directed RNA polymerase specialized sigma24 family protein
MTDSGFDDFYRSEHLLVIRFLRKLGATWDDAWDISQACFTKALDRWESLSNPAQWVRTTALHEYRNGQARRADELPRMQRGGWEPRPHFDKLDVGSQESRVCGMIGTLPPRQAEVMALTYVGGHEKFPVGGQEASDHLK